MDRAPYAPYGMAIDAAGNLWLGGLYGHLGRIDTNRCVDTASCDVSVCSGESAECDSAIKQQLDVPTGRGYGMTVDFMQRVWVAGSGGIKRYDPRAPAGSRWTTGGPNIYCNGVGADAIGFVYSACEASREIIRYNADNPSEFRRIPTGPNRGIGIDADGRVWGVNRHNGAAASVLTPGPSIDDTAVMMNVGPSLNTPYTYSDMTGLQLRLATNPRGFYRHIFDGCDALETTSWGELRWEAEIPEGTSASFRARSASRIEDLPTAEWVALGRTPPDASPLAIEGAFMDAGLPMLRYLEVESTLLADRSSFTEVITPRLLSVAATHTCPPVIE